MKTLIIGGNRFFGKRLAAELLDLGHEVSLLNRGNVDDGLGDNVKRLICDRNDTEKFKKLIGNTQWDLVFDQICFDYHQAKTTCEILNGSVKKLIFTSTISVYEYGSHLKESDVNSLSLNAEKIISKDDQYGLAKRQAEIAFNKYAEFPVISVRFPFVLGLDDYTKRTEFYIDKIKNSQPITLQNPEAKVSFINSKDAALVLSQLAEIDFSGALNVASPDPISLRSFIEVIEVELGLQASLTSNEGHSPYNTEQDLVMNVDLAKELGVQCESMSDWYPKLIKDFICREK